METEVVMRRKRNINLLQKLLVLQSLLAAHSPAHTGWQCDHSSAPLPKAQVEDSECAGVQSRAINNVSHTLVPTVMSLPRLMTVSSRDLPTIYSPIDGRYQGRLFMFVFQIRIGAAT